MTPQPSKMIEANPADLTRLNFEGLAEVSADHTIPNGGGSHKEFPENLLRAGTEPWNKWCQVVSNNSRVVIEFKQQVEIIGFGFKSANDCPHRDPNSVMVSYANPAVGMLPFSEVKLDFHQKRWHTLAFTGFNIRSSSFVFDFKNEKATEIQLGEIIFYGPAQAQFPQQFAQIQLGGKPDPQPIHLKKLVRQDISGTAQVVAQHSV